MLFAMLREWLRRAGGLIGRGRSDGELEEELRSHVELEAEAARRRGHSGEDAHREARLRTGGVAQAMEGLRDQRGVPRLSGTGQDLRMAWRALRATPLVTAVAVASLALAIGANTAIFSIVDSLLLSGLPVRSPERLVHVTDSVRRETGEIRVRAWSNPFWEQLRARPHLFESAAAWSFTRFNLASGGEAQFVDGIWADGGFFETLGVHAVAGRTFSARDDRPGGGVDGPVAVIGYGYWLRQFDGSPSAIGQVVRLTGVPFTIIGVAPREFFGLEVGRGFDVIVPLATEALIRRGDSALNSASTNFLSIVARLRPDQTLDAAGAALRGVQADIRQATLGPWDKEEADRYFASPFTVVPARTGYSYLRSAFQTPLLIIGAVVLFVLLIGCVNVANLLLARAIGRRHELSVQVALGASRWRLVRQLLAESVALSGMGAALGIGVAVASSRFLVHQLSSGPNAVVLDLPLDTRVLGFTMAVAIITALLFGTAPAILAGRARPIDAIKERGRGVAGGSRRGLMTWLVAVQVALSTVLLVAAGLFVRSFASLMNRDLGLRPDRVLVATVEGLRANADPLARLALYQRVREAVLQVPGVAEAAISHLTPLGGGGFSPPVAVSTPAGDILARSDVEIVGNRISPGWFDTFGMHLVAGRDFGEDDRSGAAGVAIVNEAFVKCCIRNGDPVGTTITVYPGTVRALRLRIVGVAANAIYYSARESPLPTWFAPIGQFTAGRPFDSTRLSVRASAASPALLTKSIAAAATSVHPTLSLTFRPLAAQVRGSLTIDRLMAQVAGFFGVLALLLAALGLYGVTAYALSRRRTEIGIRLALGADPNRVMRSVLARVALLIAVGAGAGLAVSLWMSTFVAGLLYGLVPEDPATLAGAAGVLFAIGVLSTWLPARRAARMDPAAVLREI